MEVREKHPHPRLKNGYIMINPTSYFPQEDKEAYEKKGS
jgi:hypothetical protein